MAECFVQDRLDLTPDLFLANLVLSLRRSLSEGVQKLSSVSYYWVHQTSSRSASSIFSHPPPAGRRCRLNGVVAWHAELSTVNKHRRPQAPLFCWSVQRINICSCADSNQILLFGQSIYRVYSWQWLVSLSLWQRFSSSRHHRDAMADLSQH